MKKVLLSRDQVRQNEILKPTSKLKHLMFNLSGNSEKPVTNFIVLMSDINNIKGLV